MAKLLKLRRGTTTQHGSFTGAEGEVTIDTTKDTAVVHDGSQAGGRPLLREDMANLPAGTIDNADVNASAAIAGTKISPDFGSQNIVTTGNISGGATLTVTGNAPNITFTDTDHNPDHKIYTDSGNLYIYDSTNNANRLIVNSDGHIDVTGNLDVGAGVDVTGNITATGTVDGRDVAADGTKLDGIESGATGDQTNAEIRTAIHNASDSNVFTDADHTKLNGIESGATADQTKSDIDALNINADLLDGKHDTSFLRSDAGGGSASYEADLDITFKGGAGAVTIAAASDIRIAGGTWTGEYNGGLKFQSDASNSYIQFQGTTYFRTGGGANAATLDQSGNFTATGNVTAYSDARLKTDVNTINDALGIVGKLRGVSYKWIATDKPSIGVIAQEIEEVIPEVVLTNRNTNPSTGETTEIKSVDYGKIVGVLINAINELKAEVDELKKPKKKGGK